MNLFEMSAADAAAAIQSGEISSEELVQECLNRIGVLEESVGAWEHLDPAVLEKLALYDPGNLHAAPYMWGSTGFAYNVDKVRERMPDFAYSRCDEATSQHDPVRAEDFRRRCGGGRRAGDRFRLMLGVSNPAVLFQQLDWTSVRNVGPLFSDSPHHAWCVPTGQIQAIAAAAVAALGCGTERGRAGSIED